MLKEKRDSYRMADKALIDSCDGSLVVLVAIVASVFVPWSVSEGWVQWNDMALCCECELC